MKASKNNSVYISNYVEQGRGETDWNGVKNIEFKVKLDDVPTIDDAWKNNKLQLDNSVSLGDELILQLFNNNVYPFTVSGMNFETGYKDVDVNSSLNNLSLKYHLSFNHTISSGSIVNNGSSVSLSPDGSVLAVGDPGLNNNRGAVFLYRDIGDGHWVYDYSVVNPNNVIGQRFGKSVVMVNNNKFVTTIYQHLKSNTMTFTRSSLSSNFQLVSQVSKTGHSITNMAGGIYNDVDLIVIGYPQQAVIVKNLNIESQNDAFANSNPPANNVAVFNGGYIITTYNNTRVYSYTNNIVSNNPFNVTVIKVNEFNADPGMDEYSSVAVSRNGLFMAIGLSLRRIVKLYHRTSIMNGWSYHDSINSPSSDLNDGFGHSVSMDRNGKKLVIGANDYNGHGAWFSYSSKFKVYKAGSASMELSLESTPNRCLLTLDGQGIEITKVSSTNTEFIGTLNKQGLLQIGDKVLIDGSNVILSSVDIVESLPNAFTYTLGFNTLASAPNEVIIPDRKLPMTLIKSTLVNGVYTYSHTPEIEKIGRVTRFKVIASDDVEILNGLKYELNKI